MRLRSLNTIIDASFRNITNNSSTIISPRTSKDVIMISSCLKEVIYNLENVVPVKAYDGKNSKNSTLAHLASYLISCFSGIDDIQPVIYKDFLKQSKVL